MGRPWKRARRNDALRRIFPLFVRGIDTGLLDPSSRATTCTCLRAAPGRDRRPVFGLQTLYDRYLLHNDGVRPELPQAFFMRRRGSRPAPVDREARAIEFYELLSSFDFMCSTPTVHRARRGQLSSCFLTTVSDDLDGIFKSVKDNALLAKYSAAWATTGAECAGWGRTSAARTGVRRAWCRSSRWPTTPPWPNRVVRKGAVCAYLETWHIDIEDFLALRKNTGDDRRRTHDMNTANWIPDLFMQRVEEDGDWTLFSPDEVPDLHDLYGPAFAERYVQHELRAERGEVVVHKRVKAVDLWRRMLTMLFETGHPWITFKDPCNLRSPQQHTGVIHSSNLCTEITLNTSDSEVAVCNLGSVNLANHIRDGGIDRDRLARTVRTAVRMLDNVIDINFYTIPEARRSNLRHRPVGLGIMGFQDALQMLRVPYASEQAIRFADESMEFLSYEAIAASSDLAVERGSYGSFSGSLWQRGILPIDSLELLDAAREGRLECDRSTRLGGAVCASGCNRRGCNSISWPSRRRRRFRTSAVSRSPSSHRIATCSSNRTCPAIHQVNDSSCRISRAADSDEGWSVISSTSTELGPSTAPDDLSSST